MASRPPPPESLANYLADGVPKQDDDQLRALAAWIDDLLEYRHDVDPDEIEAEPDEVVQEVDDTSEGTVVIKKVSCGKDGCKCQHGELHGPYKYVVRRQGADLTWEYRGPVEE